MNGMGFDADAVKTFRRVLDKTTDVLKSRAREYVGCFESLTYDSAKGGWKAFVQGTSRYKVRIAKDASSACTCPYGRDWGECKHIAALCIDLLGRCREEGIVEDKSPSSGKPPVVPAGRRGILPFVAPANRPAASVSRMVSEASEALRRIADILREPATTSRNPRQRVVYALEATGKSAHARTTEIVPRAQHLQGDGNWHMEPTDLRKILGGRIRTNPPQYLTETDIGLIQECTPNQIFTWPPTPAIVMHRLLEKAFRSGRLVDAQGQALELDPFLWRVVPRLVERDENGVFDLSLVATDSSDRSIQPGPGWIWFGRTGDMSVVDASRVYRIDPRVPEVLLQLFDLAGSIPLESLRSLKRELSILALNGAQIPEAHLPPIRREEPIRRVAIETTKLGFALFQVFAYPSLTFPRGSNSALFDFTDENGDLLQLERDFRQEQELSDELDRILAETGVSVRHNDSVREIEDHDSMRKLALDGLPSLAEQGWEIVNGSLLDGWRRRKGVFRMAGKASGQDWFELSGVASFDGIEVPLSTLVASRGTVILPDGSVGNLPLKLIERLEWMMRLGEATNDGIRLRPMHAALASDLADAGFGEVADRDAWTRVLEPFLDRPATCVPVPATLRATLRPYQKDGLDWLYSLRAQGLGGILADDMGLGKTVQVIAHLCLLFERDPEADPALVVGPASVAGNWIAEIERFAPHLQTRLLHGLGREALRDAPIDGPTVFVTTYGTLPSELEWLGEMEFSLAVFDESQAIRNPATVAHQTCARVMSSQNLCLTGTPIENSLADLWAQFSILNPGLLGPRQAFLDQFEPYPGERPDLSRLRILTAPFWLRRTKQVVARDLPPREDILLEVELDPKQKALYQRQLKDYQKHLLPQLRSKGLDEGGRFQVLTALLRLRQIACAPELAGHKGPASKLDVLVDKLCEDIAEGHRALVFSSFTSLLDLVGKRLDKARMDYLRMDGSTPAKERTRLIHRFQNGLDEPVFLVSLKAGGAGVNLTAADYVFLLDPWWNPAVEEQAAARAHRIGQTEPVTIYRLVAKGTIEERVMALARGKAELASALFDSGETGGKALTLEVVQELLG